MSVLLLVLLSYFSLAAVIYRLVQVAARMYDQLDDVTEQVLVLQKHDRHRGRQLGKAAREIVTIEKFLTRPEKEAEPDLPPWLQPVLDSAAQL